MSYEIFGRIPQNYYDFFKNQYGLRWYFFAA